MSCQPGSRENRRGKGNGEYMSSYQKRQAWTPEEDEILKQQVARLGTHCWPDVASGLVGRTSKACSLRWRCFLSPTIIRPNEEPFSSWEIAVIVLTQKMFGNKWNDIANYLPMRCNNDIKNHFNLYLKDKHQQVLLENNYLRQGYDLPSLLASEPEEVQQRRERLEKERANSNNFDHATVKPSNRGMSSYLRRAAPAKPKPSPVVKYHPYHLGASAAVLAAAAQPGSAGLAGVTRTGSGTALTADCDTTSPTSQQHQAYAAFTAVSNPHSAQSMGALDNLRLGGGMRTASLVAAAGLPSTFMYSSMQASYAAPSTLMGQGMLTEQMMQQNATIQSLNSESSIKQEQQPAGSTMGTTPAAAGTYSSYAGVSTSLPFSVSSSGIASDWQLNVQYTTGGMQLAGGVGGCEEGITRVPSRLQQVGHPDLSSIMVHSSSMSYTGQPQGMEQQSCRGTNSRDAAAAATDSVGLPAFEKMPSLPDPTAEPCSIFDACGDGDGTCLRGIFSSDDGEHPPLAARQGQSLGGAAAAADAPGRLLPQRSGSLANKQHGSPTEQQLAVPTVAFPSPCSFASNGSPANITQLHRAEVMQSQQQQQPGSLRHAVKLHLDIECAVRNAAYDSHVVAGGDRGALSAPCTVSAAYTPNGSHIQQQHPQQPLPHGAFSQIGQDMQQHGYMQQQQHQQVLQQSQYHHMQQQSRQQLQLPQGKYTPFGHIDNQLQQPHHQMVPDQFNLVQQYNAMSYQAAAMTVYDSGLCSHPHQQQPGQDASSPSTVAGSAAAAVARAAAAGLHSWGSSPTSDAAAAAMVAQQERQQFDLQQHQQAEEVGAHELLGHAASDDLGPLAHLLESDDTDHCGHAGHHGLVEQAECELLLSDGDFDHAEFALPGMHKDSCQADLELMAAAACW